MRKLSCGILVSIWDYTGCDFVPRSARLFGRRFFRGPDAFQAEKVMETLRQLAEDGHTVVCSIHRPRGPVYGKFDDIVLLSEGEVVYMGPAKEEPNIRCMIRVSMSRSCEPC